MTETADPPFMTLEEVAEYLRTPVNTLRYWRHKGEGPQAGRFGGRLMYRRTDVDAWAAAQFDQETIKQGA
jgi:excisionase family DNA binding protein